MRVFYDVAGGPEPTVEAILPTKEAAAWLERDAEVLKRVPLSEVKDDLSRYLRRATDAPIIVTRHGKPAGVVIGFASEDDWFDYQLENDPRFARRIERAREQLRAGRGVPLTKS